MSVAMGKLDRRSATVLAVGVAAVLVLRFGFLNDEEAAVAAPVETVAQAEMELDRLRRAVSMTPGKEVELKRAQEQLAGREKGILEAETAPQAQAQLLETIHTAAKSEGIDARGAEGWQVRPLAEDYAEVSVTVNFACTIEQLVNLLAALGNEPRLLATNEMRITVGDAKKKTLNVRLGVSAVAPRALAPEKKSVGLF
jgi:Tfp pilus assembly protein PilO